MPMLRGARTVGAPEGLLALVFGFEAGVALVDDPAICAVGFTGSVQAGRALWGRANARPVPIPFFGELGSANPLVVTPGAARERASGDRRRDRILDDARRWAVLHQAWTVVHPRRRAWRCVSGSACRLTSRALRYDDARPWNRVALPRWGPCHHRRRRARGLLVGEDLGVGTSVTPQLLEVAARTFADRGAQSLREECFGPLAVVVRCAAHDELEVGLEATDPALTFSFFSVANDPDAPWLAALGERKAGRVIANGYPTGVGVSWSMQHGGPWPATTAPAATSVGAAGIERWLRPVTFQNMPAELLPAALRDDNPLGVPQRVDGKRP